MSPERPAKKSPAFYLQRGLSFLAPLSPLLVFYLVGLMIFFVFRTAFLLTYFGRASKVGNYLFIFPTGFRMDTILLCYLLIVPSISVLLAPGQIVRRNRLFFSVFFSSLAALFVFLEIATFPFMAEFDTRLDRLFLEHMTQAHEVFPMVFKGHTGGLIIGISATLLVGLAVCRFFQNLLANYKTPVLWKRAVLLLLVAPPLYFGARSSFIHRPASIGTAAWSTSHLVNELGLNSTYSLAYAYYCMRKDESDPKKLYGIRMKPTEMFNRVRKAALIPQKACGKAEIPLLHYQESTFPAKEELNLVIILEESLGAEFVGCLGGLPLTPNMDKLSKEGLLFTRLYATGTRTVRAIEAIVSGFLPTPGTSVVKLGLSQKNFFTIAELLRRRGYATEFIYGGRSEFDNMRGFLLSNGFEKTYDQAVFENSVVSGVWGVSDEDLFAKANEIFRSHEDGPFFALILTTSNHDPFEFPDGRIDLYEHPKATRYNAMKYADYAVGRFFGLAKKERYHNNTIFLIIADHGTRLYGQDLIPVNKFLIPGLIIGPNVTPGRYQKVASQIDMVPTLLDLMGISTETPLIGRPLLRLPEGAQGRAIMQYGTTNAYMVGTQVVIQRPHLPPLQFTYKGDRLIPTELDPELLKDAHAHAILPGYLYYHSLHCLSKGK